MKGRDHIKYFFVTALCFIATLCRAQTPTDSLPGDPGGIYVYTIQNMSFGAFAHGNTGGSIIIGTDGSRSTTGDVIPLNLGFQYYNSIFEIEAPPGSMISILNGPDATLTGSNGGYMTLHIDNSSPGYPFSTSVSPPARTQVSIGGTLSVGNSTTAVPGAYTGTFYVTFNLE